MRALKKIAGIGGLMLALLMSIHLLGTEASAAENSGSWRPVFDLVMRWLNFGIIVFIIVKYARTPIKDFLLSRREEIAQEIERVELNKKEAEERIQAANRLLNESEIRFAKIKERIIQEGEKNKQKIIEDARQESKILLEATRKRLQNQLVDAKLAFQSELVDMAVSIAAERLPNEITAEDNQKMTRHFIASASVK